MAKFVKLEYFPMKDTLSYPCYEITQHCRFECVKYHFRISICLQFTKYGLVFMRHVITANKFGKGVFITCLYNPEYMKKDPTLVQNYRLVNIFPCLYKVLERIIGRQF